MKKYWQVNGKKRTPKRLILAHGAGSDMDSEWMEALVQLLIKRDIQVIRFNFPYMQKQVDEGKKYPPNGMNILKESWEKMIEMHRQMGDLFIGGKSMGGRVASLLADESSIDGLICLGFPFHAPGKEVGERSSHLIKMKTPALILQGERDSMGSKETIRGHKFARKTKLQWMNSGDHSFKPLKKSGLTLDDNLEMAADAIDLFMTKVLGK